VARPLAIIGVPSSAGAFAPGQEQAPRALRAAGLVERLERAGVEVTDYGDGALWRWRPDQSNRRAQNLPAVVAAARSTAARVQQVVGEGKIPLVLGGDCTVEVGTVAGHVPSGGRLGLIYFDLHPDLNVPESVRPGAVDWMGVAHLLGLEQATESLSRIGSRVPLLAPDEIVFFAYGPQNVTPWEREVMAEHRLYGIPVDEVAADPDDSAARALAELSSRCDRILIHLDVDTIDFTDLPLSENTGRNEGLSFDHTMRALTVLAGSPLLSALTITEINPNHGAEDGSTITAFVAALVRVLVSSPAIARSKPI
jgi:arginase